LKATERTYDHIDEKLHPFSVLIEALSAITHTAPESDFWEVSKVDKILVDLPLEIDVLVNDDNTITLGSAPPTQHIETSFMPAIQHLKLTIVRLEDLNGEQE
jgi:hypothetical protein